MSTLDFQVIEAFIINGKSHRNIQSEILGIAAPIRGGGYVAMKILHKYGIKGEHKGILVGQKFDRQLFEKTQNINNYLKICEGKHYVYTVDDK